MKKLKLLFTGTGRSASGYYSKFCTRDLGIRCGHEKIFNPYTTDRNLAQRRKKWLHLDAESSWEAAPWINTEILKDAFIVHLVRNPELTIKSWIRFLTEGAPKYWDYVVEHCPRVGAYEWPIDRYAARYIEWNRLIEREIGDRPHIRFNIENDPMELAKMLYGLKVIDQLPKSTFENIEYNKHGRWEVDFHRGMIRAVDVAEDMDQIMSEYGYEWTPRPLETRSYVVKALITTMDNLSILKRQIAVLEQEPIEEIVVVNNGSVDGTGEWLRRQKVHAIHRENDGAGPGRNAGLDYLDERYDYIKMLDGGIVPLFDGTTKMMDYLIPRPGVSGLGVEIPDMREDLDTAWARWPEHICRTYQNKCLSHTGYGLFASDAWDGIRYCTEGPFGMSGWGGDDNELMYHWLVLGKIIHVVSCSCNLPYFDGKHTGGGVHPYRKKHGSWPRLLRETGILPWADGSVLEMRQTYLSQEYPQYDHGRQVDEPWITVVIPAKGLLETAEMIKYAHKRLDARRLIDRKPTVPNPYSILLWIMPDTPPETYKWAQERRWRRHDGTAIMRDGELVRRDSSNEQTWTGDFRLSESGAWVKDLRQAHYYYGFAENLDDIESLLDLYDRVFPRRKRVKDQRPRRDVKLRLEWQ